MLGMGLDPVRQANLIGPCAELIGYEMIFFNQEILAQVKGVAIVMPFGQTEGFFFPIFTFLVFLNVLCYY
jgi:ABC-type multidrug transport system permease subunit